MPKFKWTVEIEVDEVWVADGFDLEDERMNDIMLEHLSYATSSEVKCKVLKAPSVASIRKVQGYDDKVSKPKKNEKSSEIPLSSLAC